MAQLTPDKTMCMEADTIISPYLSVSKTLTKVSKDWKMASLVQVLSVCIGQSNECPLGLGSPSKWPRDLFVHQCSCLCHFGLTKLLSYSYNGSIGFFSVEFILLAQHIVFY